MILPGGQREALERILGRYVPGNDASLPSEGRVRILYRTTDGGRTWQRWGRQAIPEGSLVLPGAS